jgi:predicted HTH domain antitoxin
MVRVDIPTELVRAAGWNAENLSAEASAVLALELYRQDKVSLGRAAELCELPVEQFMQFGAQHNVPSHYGVVELEEDRRALGLRAPRRQGGGPGGLDSCCGDTLTS